jgi:hypothetical protein
MCRSHAEPQEAAQFRARAVQTGDWPPILKLAERHGLSPLLYWNLQSHSPEAMGTSLRERFKSNAVRNLAHMQELLRILQWLSTASISAIPYKGPVLAASVYKNLGLREFFDLDILVDAADVAHAAELLTINGYQCQTQLSEAQSRAYVSSGCELCFEREGVAVELHWRIAPRIYSLAFAFPDLWARRQTLSFGEQTIATLSPEDTLLVLCVHAMKHKWNSLCWVMDVFELLRAEPNLDWAATLERARAMGAERVLLLGLSLANELFSVPLPELMKERLRDDRSLPGLLHHVRAKLAASDPGDEFSLADHLFFLRARERVVDKARYIFHAFFTPDLADWNSEKTEFWSPFYRFVRLSRVFRKFTATIAFPRRRPGRLESVK